MAAPSSSETSSSFLGWELGEKEGIAINEVAVEFVEYVFGQEEPPTFDEMDTDGSGAALPPESPARHARAPWEAALRIIGNHAISARASVASHTHLCRSWKPCRSCRSCPNLHTIIINRPSYYYNFNRTAISRLRTAHCLLSCSLLPPRQRARIACTHAGQLDFDELCEGLRQAGEKLTPVTASRKTMLCIRGKTPSL